MQAIINATQKLFEGIKTDIISVDGLTEDQIMAIEEIFKKHFETKSVKKSGKSKGTRKKTGYQMFAAHRRAELKESGQSFGDISKTIGNEWKAADMDQGFWNAKAKELVTSEESGVETGSESEQQQSDVEKAVKDEKKGGKKKRTTKRTAAID